LEPSALLFLVLAKNKVTTARGVFNDLCVSTNPYDKLSTHLLNSTQLLLRRAAVTLIIEIYPMRIGCRFMPGTGMDDVAKSGPAGGWWVVREMS